MNNEKDESANKLINMFSEFVTKHFAGSSEEDSKTITKSVDEEQRMAMFVVLEPQEGDTTTDLHGDIYSEDEVWKACNSFNKHSMKAFLFHKVETEKAKIVQSFVTPTEFTVDDGRIIKKGSWLQWWHFPENDEDSETLWNMVKAGEINGVSIGATAKSEAYGDE